MANRDHYEGDRWNQDRDRDREWNRDRQSGHRAQDEHRSWSGERSRDPSSGQGGGTYGQGRSDQDRSARRSQFHQDQHWGSQGGYGQDYGGGARGADLYGGYDRSGQGQRYGQSDYGQGNYGQSGYGQSGYGQRNSTPSSYHGQNYDPGAQIWNNDQSSGAAYGQNRGQDHGGQGYGDHRQSQRGGRTGVEFSSSVGEFEPDYLHWRDSQLQNFDRDYHSWREERRGKFSKEFDDWRNQRASQGGSSSDGDQASRLTASPTGVQDVTNGGVGRDDKDEGRKRT